MNEVRLNLARVTKPGEIRYFSPDAVCTGERVDLATKERTNYAATPLGHGTSYFLRPNAEGSRELTKEASIRVTRYIDGCRIEILGSGKFRPEPCGKPTSGLIPILNEEDCQRANGIPLL